MIWTRVAALVLGTLLVLTGCGSNDDDPPRSFTTQKDGTLDPDQFSKLVPSHLTVEVSGAVAFRFDGDVDLRIVSFDDAPGVPQFLSVGLEALNDLPDGASFRIAFDLAGVYQGAGTYEIPRVGGGTATTVPSLDPENPDPNEAARMLSRVYLTYMEAETSTPTTEVGAGFHQFENALQPCTLEVGEGDRSGKLRCPELADSEGENVEVTMEWTKP